MPPQRKLLIQKTADEVFEPESLALYKDGLHDITIRMLQINLSLESLEIVATSKFPWDHIYGPQHGVFWYLVIWNFRHNSIILMNTLIEEPKQGRLTLPRFLLDVQKYKWKDPDDLNQFRNDLAELRITKKATQHIQEKIADLRSKLYAHRLKETLTEEIDGVSIIDLRKLYATFTAMLKVVSFGTEHKLEFGDYLKPINTDDYQNSLQDVIDAVVRESDWIKMPEGEWWSAVKDYKDEQELELLKYWRKKLGMSFSIS